MKLSDWAAFSPLLTRCLGKVPLKHLLYMVRQMRYENPHSINGQRYINTFFPPVPSRAFERFIDSIIACRRIPFNAYFAVTDVCPYRCPHCSYGNHQAGSLDTEKTVEVINQLRSISTINIGFTGGEPLTREDILEIVGAVPDDCQSVMFTTGYSLTAHKAAALKSAGLGGMIIGLEVDDPDVHDDIRGVKGSFRTAIDAVKYSLGAGLYTAVSTVATHEKISHNVIENIARLASQLGAHEFRILEPVPTGSIAGQSKYILSESDVRYLKDFHKNWNRGCRGVAAASFAFIESEEMFGCGAGFHHLFIDALGNVCPCDLTPLSFGNVFDEPLYDIWLKMGEDYPLPRVGCFVREICSELSGAEQLPLETGQSRRICKSCPHDGRVPKIWKNLLKGRKPTDPPRSQE